MIQYNPKDWITFIFRFHEADTFRKLIPMMIFIGLYAGGIAYLEIEFWQLSENSHVRNIPLMHSTVGFVLSLLLAYRTNTAYERWWEGRKLWGALVNNSRNLAIKLSAYLSIESDRSFFRKAIPAYASVLSKHLLNEEVSQVLFKGLDLEIDHHKHNPNQVAKYCFIRPMSYTHQAKSPATSFISSTPNYNRLPIFAAPANALKIPQSPTHTAHLLKNSSSFIS